MNLKFCNFGKFICLISLGILLLLSFIISLDYFFYYSYKGTNKNAKSLKDYVLNYKNKTQNEINAKYIFDNDRDRKFRTAQNIKSSLKPVLIFGASSVYGLNLDENETVSYNLAKLTKRPVYNRTKPEASLNHMYYQLSNNDFYKIVPKPEYILYFYVPKQYVLMNNKLDFCQHDVYYKLKNSKLIRVVRIPIIKKSYLMAKLNIIKFQKYGLRYFLNNKNNKLFEKILIESKNEAQKHYGKDVKFVIINCSFDDLQKETFKSLSDNGFMIFDLYKFININDKIHKDASRPNAKYWQKAAIITVDKLKL